MSTHTDTAYGREILARALGHENFSPHEVWTFTRDMGITRGGLVCIQDTVTAVQQGDDLVGDRDLIRWAQGRD
jgi:hypothetical protein